MNKGRPVKFLTVHINPESCDWTQLKTFNSSMGNQISNNKQIVLNNIKYGYTIIFRANTFGDLDMIKFSRNLANIINNLDKKYLIDIRFQYNFMMIDGTINFRRSTFSNLRVLDIMFNNLDKSPINTDRVVYKSSTVIAQRAYDRIREHLQTKDQYVGAVDLSIQLEDPGQYSYALSEENPLLPKGSRFDFMYPRIEDNGNDDDLSYDNIYDDYEDEEDDESEERTYEKSKVWKYSKNKKKSIKRYGVIIADSKHDIKNDIDIVRDFLDDFIPSNSKKADKFKDTLANRFMRVYCITEKQLRKNEKRFNSKHKSKNKKSDKSRLNLFDKNWYDITK